MSNRKKREKKSSQKKHTGESEEAIEEHVSLSESEHSSNEPEGEDLLENMEKDYKPIKGLDEYEKGEFDETQYANMTLEERRKVEKVLEERDARRKFGARIPSAILAEMEGTDEEEIMRALRRKKMGFGMARMTDEQIRESEAYSLVNLMLQDLLEVYFKNSLKDIEKNKMMKFMKIELLI